jgi:hypothetical protein
MAHASLSQARSFSLDAPCNSIQDLQDGAILFKIATMMFEAVVWSLMCSSGEVNVAAEGPSSVFLSIRNILEGASVECTDPQSTMAALCVRR